VSTRTRLQNRIAELDRVEKEVAETSTYNVDSATEKNKLLADIKQQKEVCQKELGIRNNYVSNFTELKKAVNQSAETASSLNTANGKHEELKRELAKKYPQSIKNGKLYINQCSEEDKKKYLESYKQRQKAVEADRTQKDKTDKIKKKVEADKVAFYDLRTKNPNLYSKTDYNEPANPCMACLKNRAKAIGKPYETAKQAKIKSLLEKQQYSNCGVMSAAMLLNLVTCPGDIPGMDEHTMLNDAMNYPPPPAIPYATKAKERDPRENDRPYVRNMTRAQRARYESGATNQKNVKNIIDKKGENVGINVDKKPYSNDSLSMALNQKQPVILEANCKDLIGATNDAGESIDTGWEGNSGGGHAITAVDAQFDNNGKMTKVLISDTGAGKQYWMEIEHLNNAIRNHPPTVVQNRFRANARPPKPPLTPQMIVSNKPIKTDCVQ
jgi:hypothetical protein